MSIIDSIKDKAKRHQERHTELDGYQFMFSDSIAFVNQTHWRTVAQGHSVFMSIEYHQAIEQCSPDNTQQRYAIAYKNGEPKVLVACQLAHATGDKLTQTDNAIKKKPITQPKAPIKHPR